MPPPLRLHLLEGQAPSPCQHGRCSSRGPASRHHRASPATSSPPASDGVLIFSRMASIWSGDRAAGSVSWLLVGQAAQQADGLGGGKRERPQLLERRRV